MNIILKNYFDIPQHTHTHTHRVCVITEKLQLIVQPQLGRGHNFGHFPNNFYRAFRPRPSPKWRQQAISHTHSPHSHSDSHTLLLVLHLPLLPCHARGTCMAKAIEPKRSATAQKDEETIPVRPFFPFATFFCLFLLFSSFFFRFLFPSSLLFFAVHWLRVLSDSDSGSVLVVSLSLSLSLSLRSRSNRWSVGRSFHFNNIN